MSVKVYDRKKSKVEFDNRYRQVFKDSIEITNNTSGANKEKQEFYKNFIEKTALKYS